MPSTDRPLVANNPHDAENEHESLRPTIPCILVFNATDPSGSAGLMADAVVVASVGGHALGVNTGALVRDSSRTYEYHALPDEAVEDQARSVLEDMPVQAIKVGFCGTPENLGTVAEICSDYHEVPVVTYLPDLSWWNESDMEPYLDACIELLLPVTNVLCGNYSSLRRWLLPDWQADRAPSPRDIARAASEHGVSYTLVTGLHGLDQQLGTALCSAQSTLWEHQHPRLDMQVAGAGETLSTALTALLANGNDLPSAAQEALLYLEQALQASFRPGMGHALPDRMFWASPPPDDDPDETDVDNDPSPPRLQ